MPDSRFYSVRKPMPIAEVASLAGATLISGDKDGLISSVADLSDADRGGALIYCTKSEHGGSLSNRIFGLCLTSDDLADHIPKGGAVAISASPRLAFAKVAAKFYEPAALAKRSHDFDATTRSENKSL